MTGSTHIVRRLKRRVFFRFMVLKVGGKGENDIPAPILSIFLIIKLRNSMQ